MDNSIYVALSKQKAAQRQIDFLANNVANANTVGYKANNVLFRQYLRDDGNGNKVAYTLDYGSKRDISQGPLESTGNPLDLAIQGKGYFAVQTPQGERYTRAGNFTLNEQGQLATLDGNLVLDNGGQPIEFEQQDEKITVFSDGRIEVDGNERAQVGVFEFTNEYALKNISGNLLESKEKPVAMENPKVAQGMLEQSNVKPVVEITNLINTQRSFTSGAKFVSDMYELQENAIRTISKD
jgi:flagellar basal-body rod protein FlgF